MKTKTQTAEMQTARGREIAAILLKYHAERGISPEKLRLILQDLGPTFIKLGQIFSTRDGRCCPPPTVRNWQSFVRM